MTTISYHKLSVRICWFATKV